MGQPCVANSGGAQWYLGQNTGQNFKPGRRGVEMSQVVGLWTNVVTTKPPQIGGVGLLYSCTGQKACPAALFGASWGSREKSQK